MKKILLLISLLIINSVFSQRILHGSITGESGGIINAVQIINISNGQKTYNDSVGDFSIEVSDQDVIRFVKSHYERTEIKVASQTNNLSVIMIRIPEEIEEVKILKLTGDLSKDSKTLTKKDKVEILQKAIGLPKPPEIMREKAPDLKDAYAIGFPPTVIADIDALYKLISGDARRMKNQYKFDDKERNIKWLRDRIDPNYFTNLDIPKERINEFLEFSFIEDPKILQYIKNKNINGAVFYIDKTLPKFINRIKSEK